MRVIATMMSIPVMAAGFSVSLAAAQMSSPNTGRTMPVTTQLAQAEDYQKQIAPAPDTTVEGRDTLKEDGNRDFPRPAANDPSHPDTLVGDQPGSTITGRDADQEGEKREFPHPDANTSSGPGKKVDEHPGSEVTGR